MLLLEDEEKTMVEADGVCIHLLPAESLGP